MRKSKLLFTILFFIFQFIVYAQSKTEEFNAFKAKYSSKEFDYAEKIEKQIPKELPKETYETNAFSRFLLRLADFLSSLPWAFIFYTFVGLLLAFIAYRIYKNGGLFKPNSKKLYKETDFDYIEENLTEIDLNGLIKKAETEQNFPLAIRYLHYQNLQNLHYKGWIEWDPKKTNQHFINQIKNEKLSRMFSNNTNVFNQIWFGEFKIDTSKYEEYKAMFNQLSQAISA